MKDYQKYINALRKCAKEHDNDTTYTGHIIVSDLCRDTANLLEELKQEPKIDKYEYHTDHTDCIWYGSDSGCPVTCSQYRDGWNDAVNYIFKDGKGYQPYRHDD